MTPSESSDRQQNVPIPCFPFFFKHINPPPGPALPQPYPHKSPFYSSTLSFPIACLSRFPPHWWCDFCVWRSFLAVTAHPAPCSSSSTSTIPGTSTSAPVAVPIPIPVRIRIGVERQLQLGRAVSVIVSHRGPRARCVGGGSLAVHHVVVVVGGGGGGVVRITVLAVIPVRIVGGKMGVLL